MTASMTCQRHPLHRLSPVTFACTACRDEGYNPWGACENGHQMLRGGCPACAADEAGSY